MLPFALEAGIDIRDYWFLTLAEINQMIEAYRAKLKTQAAMDYRHADLIASSVGRLLDKKIKYLSIQEAYPALFDSPVPQYEDPRITKERLLKYASEFNDSFKRYKNE